MTNAGVAVAVVLVIALIIGGVFWWQKSRHGSSPSPNKHGAYNMNMADPRVEAGRQYAQSYWAGHADPKGATQDHVSMMQEPYSYTNSGTSAAYSSKYPNEDDMSSRYPRACAAGASTGAQGYEMNVDSLMPASWKGQACSLTSQDQSQWAKYAPSKEAFDAAVTAEGSARLSANTRSPAGRQIGVRNLLLPSPPLPLSTGQVTFNDSGRRQDVVYQSTGFYPQSTAC